MRRLHAIEAVQERIATEINDALIDTTQEVLLESVSQSRTGGHVGAVREPPVSRGRTDEHVGAVREPPVLSGRTRANNLVHWPQPSGQSDTRLGEMVHVRITRASPWALRGLPAGRHGVQAEAAVPA